ncbi:alpha-glucan phosphorylase [Methanosarcinales archaeon]|nr:MAG: alpha-glucan phosphorylase [Methanosarcinales archaeon]
MENVYTMQPLFPHLPERLAGLEALAENLWWSWNPGARMLFKTLDRQAWKESGHNPDKMLRELPREILDKAGADADYIRRYDDVMNAFHDYMQHNESDLLTTFPRDHKHAVAYFSAEYGLHRSLPFYAGGLGFLAGDYIKECSDLCVPLVAVGFMYPEGYFRQQIRDDGWQENLVESINREAAPISRVVDKDGRQRLRQEIVLGLGGAALLKDLGIDYDLLHLNEGHAAFALLERIREIVATGRNFATASEKIISTTMFTTHTPVAAGHDVFSFQLIEKYFHSFWPNLGLDRDAFFQLGIHPEKPDAGFNMTAFALRLSGCRNAVSKRHAQVSRHMWRSLWPDRPEDQVPIDSITNGVHVPTWIEPKMKLLLDKYLGPVWLEKHDDPAVWQLLDNIPDTELWQTHYWLKVKLIDAIRERVRLRWANGDAGTTIMLAGGAFLDPSVLALGFARRFATYKRALLIFQDLERLTKLLKDRWCPIQIIFAGKAHPADDPGKRVLQELINLARNPRLGGRIAFVEDYGEQLAQYLVHGVDIWLNNPLPPFEACGTSGMKAGLNGVPHLSILDGWWEEGFNGNNGWAIEREGSSDNPDESDAQKIYQLLEDRIIPLYYNMSENGIPLEWVRLMKETIKSTAAGFSARRMVKQYIEKFYSRSIKKALEN